MVNDKVATIMMLTGLLFMAVAAVVLFRSDPGTAAIWIAAGAGMFGTCAGERLKAKQ
jgi:hypothetical protein